MMYLPPTPAVSKKAKKKETMHKISAVNNLVRDGRLTNQAPAGRTAKPADMVFDLKKSERDDPLDILDKSIAKPAIPRHLAQKVAERAGPKSTARCLPALEPEMVNHPAHYNNHPSGVECIEIVEHMPYNIGNAIAYLWRMDDKGTPIQDMEKAIWHIKREIYRRKEGGAEIK